MLVFVTGVNGQLGHDVVNELHAQGISAVGSDIKPAYCGIADDSYVTHAPYESLDITNKEAVASILARVKPDAVIHCAAWTNVDGAEDEANRDIVMRINAEGTRNIAEATKAIDAKMIYISTDYVFNGKGTEPWDEDCVDYEPLNHYGKSKLAGEMAVREMLSRYFIVRTAWVFGRNGNNFVKTMVKLAATHPKLRVVNDQVGTPTYTPHLARLLVDMVQTDRYGTYHATNSGGFISWYDFAVEIFKEAKLSVTVEPVTTAQYGLSKAKRPENSRLGKEKLSRAGFQELPHWKVALKDYLRTF